MPKPADPLADTLYDMPSLNRLFFVASLLLIAATVWAAWQDYDRNWKNYQRDFEKIALERAQKELKQIQEAVTAASGPEIQELNKKLEAARGALGQRKGELDKLEEEREKNRGPREKALMRFQFDKSEADTAKQRAEAAGDHLSHTKEEIEHLRKEGKPTASLEAKLKGLESEAAEKLKEFQEWAEKVQKAKLDWEELDAKERAAAKQIDDINAAAAATQKEIDRLEADVIAKKRVIARLEPTWHKDVLNAPGMDFVAPTIKINQLILPHFREDLNFSSVEKIDRCTTCHLAIDKKGWTESELPKAFRSHPNLDLYVGDGSPHPMGKFGCTTCHEGAGRSVDFYTAAHMPRSKEQAKEWEQKYGWQPIHHFDKPMLPMPYIEASCTKCHSEQVRVTMGDKVNQGKAIMEKVGCYGCHPIAGTENLRKPGPGLNGLKHKVTKDWAFNWIRKPADFRPTTHMPQVFDLSNTSDPDSLKKNAAMIAGIVEYLWDKGGLEHVKGEYPAPPAGDAKKGKALFNAVGCTACHVAGDMNKKGTEYTNFGPNLATVGSKLNAGWTFAWLKDPQQYFHYASMPSLRLSDAESADITAYLLTLKHPGDFPNRKVPEVPDADLDAVILDFQASKLPDREARAELAKMSRPAKLLFIGEKAIGQQGCFGCHDIRGFEKTKRIGAELTGSNATGSKDITKFDFGFRHDLQWSHQPGAYDRVAWVRAKLEDPRTFDHGRFVSYVDRLRMPKFNLTADEIEALTTYVLSFRTRENIPAEYQRVLNHQEKVVNAGKRLALDSNCASCHKMGLYPQKVGIAFNADTDDAEKAEALIAAKMYLARTVLTDGRQVDRISPDELAILKKKGVEILLPAGTWLGFREINALNQNVPPVTNVFVYGYGEAQIIALVNREEGDNKAPPFIVGEGAKVNPDWFFRFLKSPTVIRPWLQDPKLDPGVRMPTFGFTDQEALTLVEHFALIAGEQYPFQYEPAVSDDARKAMIAKGEKVFDAQECWKCHVTEGKRAPTGGPAPPFRIVGPRIQSDWFRVWVRDPGKIAPGVNMPQYDEATVSDEDLEALREYIWSLSRK